MKGEGRRAKGEGRRAKGKDNPLRGQVRRKAKEGGGRGTELSGRTGHRGGDRVIRRLSRRAFVGSLAALAASPAIVFKLQSAYAQQPASARRIGVLLVGFSRSKLASRF